MKRLICILLVCVLLIGGLSGCNEMPAVDKSVKPEEHLSQYKKLTDLYGTPWRDVLSKLDIDLQELDTEGLNHVGVPIQENYAGLEFDTYLRFGGDENYLCGVTLSATYQYPDEEERFLRDTVAVCRELISDFGDPSDTSIVFNWVEKYMGEQWNRDIQFWQDVQVLKRLADSDFSGTLLFWNLIPVAGEAVLKTNDEFGLSVCFSIQEEEGIAVLNITY